MLNTLRWAGRLLAGASRWAMPGVLLAAAAACFAMAWHRSDQGGGPAGRAAAELTGRLAREDPEAAAELGRLREVYGPVAAAAAFRAAEAGGGLSGLRRLALRRAGGRPVPEADLAALATDVGRAGGAEAREKFLAAHAATVGLLGDDDDAVAGHLAALREAAAGPDWAEVRDDPVALVVCRHLADDRLRRYFLAERGWLAGCVAGVEDLPGPGGDPARALRDRVAAAADHHPHCREAAVGLGLGELALAVFMTHGAAIDRAVKDHRLPLEEVMDVAFCNGDALAGLPPDAAAGLLERAYRGSPLLWLAARTQPLTLRLLADAPAHAERLVREHGADGVAGFLYASYPSEIEAAAAAVAASGDLAIHVLDKYADDERVHALLGGIGPRVVPYLLRFGDQGIDQLGANRAWLDKELNPDGTPKDKEFWTKVPVLGGPADLVRNWARGYPIESQELGWAALEVADGALLLVSLGTSAELTIAKEAFKQGGRTVFTAAVARAAREAARRQAATAARGGRAALRKQFLKGQTRSLLRRAAGAVRGASTAAPLVKLGPVAVGPAAARAAELLRRAAAWAAKHRVPPALVRVVVSAALSIQLTINISRGSPGRGDAADDLPRRADELLASWDRGMAVRLGRALADDAPGAPGAGHGWPFAAIPAAALLAGVALTWPRGRGVRRA